VVCSITFSFSRCVGGIRHHRCHSHALCFSPATSGECSWARPCLLPPPLQLQPVTSSEQSQLQAEIIFVLAPEHVASIDARLMRVTSRVMIVRRDGAEMSLTSGGGVRFVLATNNDRAETFEELDSVTVAPPLEDGSFVLDCPGLRTCSCTRMRVLVDALPRLSDDGDVFVVLRDVHFTADCRSAPPLPQLKSSVALNDVLARLLAALDGAEADLLSRVVLTRHTNSSAWNKHRSVWNGLIDRFPAIIVVARDEDDVCRTVALARELSLELTVKGGGHNVAGSAVADGALMIDLSLFNRVSVHLHASSPRITVGGGCTWAAVDAALHPHGLAVPAGAVPRRFLFTPALALRLSLKP
jgi:hypothetical protein